jgi:hypothetical protein
MTTLERLIASWRASPDGRHFREGATASELEAFEARSEWKLPAEWRELYAFTNGVVLSHWMELYPLFGAPSLLDGHKYWPQRWNWPVIPEDLWIAGWSGGEGEWATQFGLWLPSATEQVGPVVEMDAKGGLTVAGSSLIAFLVARTTRDLIGDYDLINAPDTAFDALGVPHELRRSDGPEGWVAIGRWADPGLPGGDYISEKALDAQAIMELLGSRR